MAIRHVCALMACENAVSTLFAHAIQDAPIFKGEQASVCNHSDLYLYNELHSSSRWCAIMANEAGPKKCVGGSNR